jgi:hypothetical protein
MLILCTWVHNDFILFFLILQCWFLYMGAYTNNNLIILFLILQCWFLYMGAYRHNNLIFLFLILHVNILYMGAQWQAHLILLNFASSFSYIHGCKMAISFYSILFRIIISLYMGAHPTCSSSSCEFAMVIFILGEEVIVAKLKAWTCKP